MKQQKISLLNDLNTGTKTINIRVNQSAIQLMKSHAYHTRTKYITLKYHKIRGEFENGQIYV